MKSLTKFLSKIVLGALLGVMPLHAGEIAFPDVPLFLKEELPPNIFLTLDNSTSMQRADIFDGGTNCPVARPCWTTAQYNRMYYDPSIAYQLPLNADGTSYPEPTIDAAFLDGFNNAAGTINLTTDYSPTQNYLDKINESPLHQTITLGINDNKAFYHLRNANLAEECTGTFDIQAEASDICFDLIDVTALSDAEQLNFAIWYSYYRTRMMLVKAAASITFYTIPPDIRVGWADLHHVNDFNVSATDPGKAHNFSAPFTSQHKQNFFTWIAEMEQQSGTPLITAMNNVGEFLSDTSSINPFANQPQIDNPDYSAADDLSCRQNFHVMFSDGGWYEGVTNSSAEDYDNQPFTLPDGNNYVPQPPYAGPHPASRFLADRAFYYWSRDARPDLDNNLTAYLPEQQGTAQQIYWNSKNDPATWQHLVHYMVTMGVSGNLDYPGDFEALSNGTLAWAEPSGVEADGVTPNFSEETKIDDNWHAAVNSRGEYFSANNTSELVDSFGEILTRIGEREATASAVTTDSTQSADTRYLYRASFSSGDWTGTLQGYDFNNLLIGNLVFDSGCRLTGGLCEADGNTYSAPSPTGTGSSSRRMVTWSPAAETGIPFRSFDLANAGLRTSLHADQPQAESIINYLRGVRSGEEQNGGSFRDRESLLGDIINSSPTLVYTPQRTLPNRGDWEDKLDVGVVIPENSATAETFAAFTTRVANRQGMVYVGANDGMLHAFNGVNGTEAFAYIPSVLMERLPALTDPNYLHEFFVDGTPAAGDAFFDNSWHTVLVGHLRSGGQMVYALDVTTEAAASDTESDIANRILWEFTHPDLGNGVSTAEIARLHNGRWAAIIGNGYNNTQADGLASATGEASIFVVDLETGDLIKHLRTGVGSTLDPNGIGGVRTVDVDGDFIVDYAYGGDLYGNLWKFDLTDRTAGPVDSNDNGAFSGWRVAYSDDNGNPAPYFVAVSSTGAQAITQKPSVVLNPIEGINLIFGTGKYLEEADTLNNTVVNSYYGLWDRIDENTVAPLTRSNLNQRLLSADATNSASGTLVRSLDGEPVDYSETDVLGWYFDFYAGELQFTEATSFNDNLIVFTTFEPSIDECVRGGTSWLYVISTFQGDDPGFIPFDVSGDNFFDANDLMPGDAIVSGMQLEGSGVIAPLNILSSGTDVIDNQVVNKANILGTDIDGNPVGGAIQDLSLENRGGRVKWRQIK